MQIETEINLQHTEDVHNQVQTPDENLYKARDYTIQAIKLFRPDFDLDKIVTYFLTEREYSLLNTLAITYGELGDWEKQLEIMKNLKTSLETHSKIIIEYFGQRHVNKTYRALRLNIDIASASLGRWEECVQIATENMEFFLKYNDINLYARSIYRRAFSLLKLGRTEEGNEYYKKFFMLAYVLDGNFSLNFDFVKKQYEELFGGQLEISAAW